MISSAGGVTLGGKASPGYVWVTPAGEMLVREPARRQPAPGGAPSNGSTTPRAGAAPGERVVDTEYEETDQRTGS